MIPSDLIVITRSAAAAKATAPEVGGDLRDHAGVTPYHVHLETFGCQMNEYDSDLIRSLLKAAGFVFTADKAGADVVLLNTCAIRENAHAKVYGHLAALKPIKRSRSLVVGVLGCMAQNLKQDLLDTEPVIDVLVGPDGYRRLPDLLHRALAARTTPTRRKGVAVELSEYETYQDILPEQREGMHGWIAVMRGCDNFCSFCVVPYTRGRERSREPESIIREAAHLAARGYKQVTLLGQNVNSYRYGTWDFARLLVTVGDVPGIERVRFTSPHPKDFPPALLDAVAGHPHVCKHIHLPLQAGNDRILALMGRNYTRKDYLQLVGEIRRRRADIILTTDIICGFCSEREEEYLETFDVVREVGYHSAFIFKYSERKQTIASRKYRDDVPDDVKARRVTRLVEYQKSVSWNKNQEMLGRILPVLVEGDAKRSADQWMGRTDGGITVVWEKAAATLRPGDVIPIAITRVSATTLFGVPSVP